MRKALCFGAGNIGRGFIAQVCQDSNIQLIFVDVNTMVLDRINTLKKYYIHILDGISQPIEINNILGINSNDLEVLSIYFQEVDFIFTAVGPNVLPHVGATLAYLYTELPNVKHYVIACENMVGGSTTLKKLIIQRGAKIPQDVQFLDAAVDRIVPLSQGTDTLDVKVEPQFEWIVQAQKHLDLNGVIEVIDLEPYIKRKLLMVNGAHAFSAYLGYIKGYTTIDEALSDTDIEAAVRGLLFEHQIYLNHTYNLSMDDLQHIQDKSIKRFKNALLQDDCIRVGRTPQRKIGVNERLAMGIETLLALGIVPRYAFQAIAAATLYQEDEEGQALSAMTENELKQVLLDLPLTIESVIAIIKQRHALTLQRHALEQQRR